MEDIPNFRGQIQVSLVDKPWKKPRSPFIKGFLILGVFCSLFFACEFIVAVVAIVASSRLATCSRSRHSCFVP